MRLTTLVTPDTCSAILLGRQELFGGPDIAAESHHAIVGSHGDVARIQHLCRQSSAA